jgi:predicted TIM-barrel fold metal-dependent hydrolase
MSDDILISTAMRDAATLARPRFAVPPASCDSHVHVFGPASRYPHVAKPHYTLPDGAPRLLEAMTRALGIDRVAIVQPSFYGTDNRCMLDALAQLGSARARGVAMVDDDVGAGRLEEMHALGVRALRLDLFLRAAWALSDITAYIRRSAQLVASLGWHLQFYTPGYVVRELIPMLADIECEFVIDHMGYMLESDGLTRSDFDRLVEAMRRGRGWMKLSGPYRVAKDGNFAKLAPLAQSIVDALGDRTIWGSDWPHIPDGSRDTGSLLQLLGDWVPDADARARILSANPARLYGWSTA